MTFNEKSKRIKALVKEIQEDMKRWVKNMDLEEARELIANDDEEINRIIFEECMNNYANFNKRKCSDDEYNWVFVEIYAEFIEACDKKFGKGWEEGTLKARSPRAPARKTRAPARKTTPRRKVTRKTGIKSLENAYKRML